MTGPASELGNRNSTDGGDSDAILQRGLNFTYPSSSLTDPEGVQLRLLRPIALVAAARAVLGALPSTDFDDLYSLSFQRPVS